MREAHEKLFTPRDLAEQGIMSDVKQWQERKAKRLGFYQLGRKIYYSQTHLAAFFASCERKSAETKAA
jgi:FMN phosphatase YigB (HAD superfamily)